MIIHVQIDQDFGCSPYSAGHFPYCQLPASRGRGDRDKARPVSTEKEARNRLNVHANSTRGPASGRPGLEGAAGTLQMEQRTGTEPCDPRGAWRLVELHSLGVQGLQEPLLSAQMG